MKIIILGAGISGLSAAYFLSKKGHSITLIDKTDKIGGLCTRLQEKDYHFDYGPHIFHTNKEDVKKVVLDVLKGKNQTSISLYAKSFQKGILHDYPISIDNIFLLDKQIQRQVIRELYEVNRSKLETAKTFEDYVITLIGPTLYNIYFKNYSKKLWGIDPKIMPAEWAPSRISFRMKEKEFFPKEWQIVPEGGIDVIMERFLELSHAEIYLGTETTKLIIRGDKVKGIEAIKEGKTLRIPADFIISTIPLPELTNLIGISSEKQLSYRSMIFVFFGLSSEKDTPKDIHWIYFPSSDFISSRLTFQDRIHPEYAPFGKYGITLEIPCSFGDYIWNLSDDELFESAKKDLLDTGYYKETNIIASRIIRVKTVYPIKEMDSVCHVKEMINSLYLFKNLISSGRLGLFKYINMDQAIALSSLVANLVSSWATENRAARYKEFLSLS